MEWVCAFRENISLPPEWLLAGYEVVDMKERSIAPVLDVLCDREGKKARYLMVEIGGTVGISGKKLLLPPEVLARTEYGVVVVSASLKDVQELPAPEDPENPTRAEERAVYRHFRLRPYWLKVGEKPERVSDAMEERLEIEKR